MPIILEKIPPESPARGDSPDGHVNGYTGEDTAHRTLPLTDIAIVGIGLRLPGGVTTTDEYWDLLMSKTNTLAPVPDNRYGGDAFTSQGLPGTMKNTYGHYLDCEFEKWDASFFSMSRVEVEKLDPQQRLLLQVVWECMQSGGQTNWRGGSNIGCYVGTFGEDWLDLYAKDPQHGGIHRVLGTNDFAIANRVSYEYNLKGPSVTVRTACSSSLYALHQACEAIKSGDCESAVVAGCSVLLSPTMPVALAEQGVLSPTGGCKSFDASADGYTRGEAVNAVFIKPLARAIADGDPIRGVIKGTATNFDGKTIGISNPSQDAHVALMKRAYQVAGINNPADTGFVECHGTGTPVGDPIETGAVGRVFGSHGMYIGSVKPNIGHSEGASGLSSLIKAVLALEHETIPPNISFSKPSPKIEWGKYNFKVPTDAVPWPKDRKQRVSVNCFGVGGANAHCVVDSAKEYVQALAPAQPSPHLLLFSAHQDDAAQANAAQITHFAEEHQDKLSDIAYTLSRKRDALPHRTFAVTSDVWPAEIAPVAKTTATTPDISFVFTGQGAQWQGMGADLIRRYPSFKSDVQAMDLALQKLTHPPSWSVEGELLQTEDLKRIQRPEFSQPLCTAVQIGLVNLLASWTIAPTQVVGHSSGEIAAAYAAGALTLDTAIAIAYYRGQIMSSHGRAGGMAAIGLGRADVKPFLKPGVVVACENSPKNVTLSGDEDCLDEVVEAIKAVKPDCFARRLRVERAYHSHHMAEIGNVYEGVLDGLVDDTTPRVPMFSTVLSKKIRRGGMLGPSYWRQNLDSPVLFSPTVSLMQHANTNDTVYLELGPHSALAGPLRDIFKHNKAAHKASYVATLIRNEGGVESLLKSLGRLFQEGIQFDMTSTLGSQAVLTSLPNYAWQNATAYWHESRVSRDWRLSKTPRHELLGIRTMESDSLEPTWRNMLRLDDVPWARDHRIQDDIVLPAAAYIAMAAAAVRQVETEPDTEDGGVSFRHVTISNALVLRESHAHEVVTHLRKVQLTSKLDSAWYDFSIISLQGNSWIRHCTGQVRIGKSSSYTINVARQPRSVSRRGWYRAMSKVGLNYGAEFQGLSEISARPGANHAVATVSNSKEDGYLLHPRVIDLVLQAFTVAIADGLTRQLNRLRIPTYMDELYLTAGEPIMRLGTEATAKANGTIVGSAAIMAGDRVILSLKGGEFSPLEEPDAPEAVPGAHLHWKPDLDFIPTGQLVQHKSVDLERMALVCVLEMLFSDTTHREWLTQRLSAFQDRTLANMSRDEIRAEFKELQVQASIDNDAAAKLLVNLVSRRANAGNLRDFVGTMADYKPLLQLLAHKNPVISVLEVGTGAVAMTEAVLNGLTGPDGTIRCRRYVRTNVRKDLLPDLTCHGADKVESRVFDASNDPAEQDLPGPFDLIVAPDAAKIDAGAMKNVCSLLKPDGRIILQTFKQDSLYIDLVRKLWQGEWPNHLPATTSASPSITDACNAAGMTQDLESHGSLIEILTPTRAIETPSRHPVSILRDSATAESQDLRAKLTEQGYNVSFSSLGSPAPPDTDIICLLDVEEPFFYAMSASSFASFNAYLSKFPVNSALLWVTGHSQVRCKDPRYANTIGTFRNIRSEMSLDWATLEVDLSSFDAAMVVTLFNKLRTRAKSVEFDPDWEYAAVDGDIMVPRFEWSDCVTRPEPLLKGNNPCTLEAGRLGQLDSLAWVQNECGPLQSHEIEIATRTIGMNFKDVLVAMGVVQGYKPGLGLECAGVVRRIGSGVTRFVPGDKVMALTHNCFASSFVTDHRPVIKMPAGISFEEAATVPCVYTTVIHSLLDLGHLRGGQTVLVHSACGGVGIAALNVCRMIGATAYATVGSEEKVEFLMENYNMPREHIFYSRDGSFYDDVMRETTGRGVDLVLNSLSGELLHTSWRCVAAFGKMLEIGKSDFIGHGQLGMAEFEANRSFHGVEMAQMIADRPDMILRLLKQFNEFYARGELAPIGPVKVYDAHEAIEAFRYMQKGQHIGKVIVRIPESTRDLAVVPRKAAPLFRHDAMYLLVGGLGGLGRSVATWMVQNGARHLMFMSRSAGNSAKDVEFIRELGAQGCCVQVVRGSVTEYQDVVNAVHVAWKPIVGVFLMTMVLRDKGILQLTHDDWFTAADPKVKGALNLHNALASRNLDFFVLFSSISYVVGQIGQANYSAANAYLAAFTQFRHSMGMPASVLNVGVMDEVGYVVENQSLLDQFRALHYYTLSETELLEALAYSVTHQWQKRQNDDFVNTAELSIGLHSTQPLSDKNTRAIWKRDRRMSVAHMETGGNVASGGGGVDLTQFLKQVASDAGILDVPSNLEFLTRQIGECICNLMSRPVKDLDVNVTLAGLGVDSLVAIEIRNWWRRTLGVATSVLELMSTGSIANLGVLAAEQLKSARIAAAATGQ